MSNGLNGKDFFIGAVVGGILGAVTALLLAPKPGRELREDISGQYEKLSGKTVEISSAVSSKAQALAKNVGTQTGEIVEKAKEVAGIVTSEVKAWRDSRKEVAPALEEPEALDASEAPEETAVVAAVSEDAVESREEGTN